MADAVAKMAHPLADEQVALDLVARLSAEPVVALRDLGAWLDALADPSGLRLIRKLEIVDLVGRSARDHLKQIQAEYLSAVTRSHAPLEGGSWSAAAAFLRRLAVAYLHIVQQFQTYVPGWGQLRDRLPSLMSHAMNVAGKRLKWQMLRYAPVEKELWTTLAQLWACAEDRSLTAARAVLHEDSETNLQREFLKPLMMAMSAGDTLSPQELDMAERIVAHFSDDFELNRHPGKDCYFYIDIDVGNAPQRFMPGTRTRPGMRFFGPGGALAKVEELAAAVAAGSPLPEELELALSKEVGTVVEVLDHLARHWGARRPGRNEERKRTLSEIATVSGFEQIVSTLSAEAMVDLALDAGGEVWKVENESEGGYGAVVPLGMAEWVRVGGILGVRPMGSRTWAVGIVRRLAARETDDRYIGIQVIGRGARVVTLMRPGESRAAMSAVLLPSHVGESVSQGEVTLLLPAGGFSTQGTLAMRVYERQYLIEPRMLLETGNDYDMAYYRISGAAD
jgi:hypothetical protein